MSHTPGPWTYSPAANDGGLIRSFTANGNLSSSIASAHHRIDRAEFEGNARLIAAAPDLLNALEVLASAAEARGIPADAARAAIAKAKGTA